MQTGNGRDWWLITHKWNSDTYYKFLISPEGVSAPIIQQAGPILPPSDGLRDFDATGAAVFSPNGNQYAMAGPSNELYLFDFDRCTGMLNNLRMTTLDTNDRVRSCSFSPNSRYLYVSSLYNVYQFDSWASDLASSEQLVAQWDSTIDTLFSIKQLFFVHQLAPDGKIYISNFGGSHLMHVIDSPDSAGNACNVLQHHFDLPNYNHTIPNFPNYDLGPLTGSICDSLSVGTNDVDNPDRIKIFPNPAVDHFIITYDLKVNRNASFILIDELGHEIINKTLYGVFKTLVVATDDLARGIYFYRVIDNEKLIAAGKISLVK